MNAMNKVKSLVRKGTAAMSLAVMTLPFTAMAGPATGNGGSGDAGSKASTVADNILEFVTPAFGIVGTFFIFSGIWKVANAFRNDSNPEAMSAGAKDIVVGAIFAALAIGWNAIKGTIMNGV